MIKINIIDYLYKNFHKKFVYKLKSINILEFCDNIKLYKIFRIFFLLKLATQ